MKVALLIVTFNRIEYLKECFWSIENANLSQISEICIIDNNSEKQVRDFIKENSIVKGGIKFTTCFNENKQGISANLLQGYEHLFKTYDIVINFDSDALIRPDCITKLLRLYKPNTLLTGFHSTTENRHTILSEHDGYCIKQSVGGINFCIDKSAYTNFVKPALLSTIPHGNWDHQASIKAGGVMCAIPSLVQHIGFESTLGHHDNPDVADDFYYWHLPDITLFGVDSNANRLQEAANKCTKWIKFGDVVLLNPDIRSKEQYSRFIIDETYKHIKASHVLIFQHDGFVNNWKEWDNEWMQYDYIGAPWWYNDGMDVGNGGFSLRSKRLMEILATDKYIKYVGLYHPEDDVICRKYRKYLEAIYDIKFAPLDVAERFSFEGYGQPTKYLKDQFGVHGSNPRTKPQGVKRDRYVFNQFLSLGDILFLVPMYRALVDEGNDVLWPIDPMYLDIKKHFPDVNFVNKNDYPLPYESRIIAPTKWGKLLPYRFASELRGKTLRDCMNAKYELYGHNYLMWRNLNWVRDRKAEAKLIELVGAKGSFILVNRSFGHEAKMQADIQVSGNVIEMRKIDGFTLIDWLGVAELATEIHVANSAIMYLLELMNLAVPTHVYKRGIWGEQAFEYTRHLWTNNNFIFEK